VKLYKFFICKVKNGSDYNDNRGIGLCEGFMAFNVGTWSPEQNASSECRWKRQPLDLESSFQYVGISW
jgi:hypothetical protein